MKREPYIITENLTSQEIADLISRAYNEGYEDGKKDYWTVCTTPLKDIQITPATSPPNTIYYNSQKSGGITL